MNIDEQIKNKQQELKTLKASATKERKKEKENRKAARILLNENLAKESEKLKEIQGLIHTYNKASKTQKQEMEILELLANKIIDNSPPECVGEQPPQGVEREEDITGTAQPTPPE